MSYAVVQDIPASWHDYENVAAVLLEAAPSGLIVHAAGPTDDGFRMIAIWDTEAAWQHFRSERLAPAIAALSGPGRPEPTIRGLHSAHLVVGAPWRAQQTRSQGRQENERRDEQ